MNELLTLATHLKYIGRREPSFKIYRPALLMLLNKILPRALCFDEPQERRCALKPPGIILLLPV